MWVPTTCGVLLESDAGAEGQVLEGILGGAAELDRIDGAVPRRLPDDGPLASGAGEMHQPIPTPALGSPGVLQLRERERVVAVVLWLAVGEQHADLHLAHDQVGGRLPARSERRRDVRELQVIGDIVGVALRVHDLLR